MTKPPGVKSKTCSASFN